jgi:hypothetical protein
MLPCGDYESIGPQRLQILQWHRHIGWPVTVPMYAVHQDETIGPDPFTFDPYRSSRVREKDADDVKQQLVTSSPEFLPWGYGKHARYVIFDCIDRERRSSPTVNELKTMLDYV